MEHSTMIIKDKKNNQFTINIKNNVVPFIANEINYNMRIDISLESMAKALRKLGYTGQIKGLIHADILLRERAPALANELSYLSSYYFIKQVYKNDNNLIIELFQDNPQALTNHYGLPQTAPQLLLTQLPLLNLFPQYNKVGTYADLM